MLLRVNGRAGNLHHEKPRRMLNTLKKNRFQKGYEKDEGKVCDVSIHEDSPLLREHSVPVIWCLHTFRPSFCFNLR